MQEQSQEWWFSLGHSMVPKFWWPEEGSQVPSGSGQSPCSVKDTREQCFLLQRESSGMTWFLLTRAGFLSLHVICLIFTYLSPADPRGAASTRGQFVRVAERSKVIVPRGESPLLPASPREHSRCLPGSRDLTTLELPFSCTDPFSIYHGELCRPSAQLPASPQNVKAWYPHPLWNLAETNLGNQDRSAFGNKTKVV